MSELIVLVDAGFALENPTARCHSQSFPHILLNCMVQILPTMQSPRVSVLRIAQLPPLCSCREGD
jgi:hypothetical protein